MSKSRLDKTFKKGRKFGAREIDLDSSEFEEIDRAIEEENRKSRHHKKPNKKVRRNDDYDS